MPMPTPTPNQARIRKFVEALRSKRFRQGHGALHRMRQGSDEYCCLGVACEVAIEDGLDLKVSNDGHFVRYGDEFGHLPISVQAWYGFESENPSLTLVKRLHWWQRLFRKPVTSKRSAVAANDGLGWNFDHIADAFERKYLK